MTVSRPRAAVSGPRGADDVDANARRSISMAIMMVPSFCAMQLELTLDIHACAMRPTQRSMLHYTGR